MKRIFFPLLLILPLLVLTGCKLNDDEEKDTAGVVTLNGQVLDAETSNPIEGALVTVLPYNLVFETDDEGRFEEQVEIDSTMDLQIRGTMEGYSTETAEVLAVAGRDIEVPPFRLTRTAEEAAKSGKASSILLKEQSAKSIGVRESGSVEVTQITFQVADSLGRPVILDKQARVQFTLGEHPGGGEYIFPAEAETDNNGLVVVNLSSGTRAGVVQIMAQSTVDGRTIRSLPVAVSIHGGLPDQAHFTLGPKQINYPGLLSFGLVNEVSVLVGDKYGNPVRPGTSVYFTTDYGVIEGSVQTDEQGMGTVRYLSGNPMPPQGVAHVTATTADENRNQVHARAAMVLSGDPEIRIEPAVARIGQDYKLTITDPLGNPLAPNAGFSVKVEGTKVKAVGNTNVRFSDTVFRGGLEYENVRRGRGITEFVFSAVEDWNLTEEGTPTIETITITVDGPNGSTSFVMTENGVQLKSRNVVMQKTTNGVLIRHK